MKKWAKRLLLPFIFVFVLLTLYPLLHSLIMSFYNFKAGEFTFVGFNNYKIMMRDNTFHKAFKNTIIFIIFQIPIMLGIAFVLAYILHNLRQWEKKFFSTVLYLPTITSLVATALLFSSLLQDSGLINNFLIQIGLQKVAWLTDPVIAKISIMISMTWRWTGYNMVIYLSALQSIPKSSIEAARIDGASELKILAHIVLPLIKPTILFTTIFSAIGTLQLFDEPFNLTQGGPGNSTLTLGMYIYENAFQHSKLGYSAALSLMTTFIIIILFAFYQIKVRGEEQS